MRGQCWPPPLAGSHESCSLTRRNGVLLVSLVVFIRKTKARKSYHRDHKACGEHAFIATLLYDPSMTVLPIVGTPLVVETNFVQLAKCSSDRANGQRTGAHHPKRRRKAFPTPACPHSCFSLVFDGQEYFGIRILDCGCLQTMSSASSSLRNVFDDIFRGCLWELGGWLWACGCRWGCWWGCLPLRFL